MIELKKDDIKIEIAEPYSEYSGVRFDHMGFIKQVYFKAAPLCSEYYEDKFVGAGLCNEFGISEPIGYEKNKRFLKLGVGTLTADNDAYSFMNDYEMEKPEYEMKLYGSDKISFEMKQALDEYALIYKKTITITDKIEVDYELTNTGSIEFSTEEYAHNFLTTDNSRIIFNAPVHDNPSEKIKAENEILTVSEGVEPMYICRFMPIENREFSWTLRGNTKICEKVDFNPCQFSIWKTDGIVSPEINFSCTLKPGETMHWKRIYEIK